jgi:uncharacterized membrane protein
MFRRVQAKYKQFPSVLFLFLIPQVLFANPSIAAGTVVFSALGIPCTQHTANDIYAHRYVAGTNGQITAINVLLPNGAVNNATYKANFPSATYLIMANNGSSAPNSTLATFTSDTMTGVNARFVGSYSITAGTKFWVVAGQGAAVFPDCFTNSTSVPNANITFSNGWRFDTATPSSWPYVTGSTPATLGNPINSNFVFAISIEIASPAAATVSVSLQSGGTGATYRAPTTVRASASTDGKVTFYQAGKVIVGCRNVLTVSSVATCSWRPSVHGGASLTAKIIPTDSSIPQGVSPVFTAGVTTRANNR